MSGPNSPIDDAELIRRAVGGNVSAFNGLVERYQGLAYSVAYRSLGDAESAADATQDAFISAFNALRHFRGGSFKAWLLRIVTNACLDAGRRTTRHYATSLELMLDESGDGLIDPGPRPESEALRAELVEHIQGALLHLPFHQRVAVVLADLHGLSYEEIAETTRTSLGTVKSRINRGRQRLRDILMAQPELLPAGLRP